MERRKDPSKTLPNTWELCVPMAFYFSMLECGLMCVFAFNVLLFMCLSLTNEKSAQMFWKRLIDFIKRKRKVARF